MRPSLSSPGYPAAPLALCWAVAPRPPHSCVTRVLCGANVEEEEWFDEFARGGDWCRLEGLRRPQCVVHQSDQVVESRREVTGRIVLRELLDDHHGTAVGEIDARDLEKDDFGRQDDLLLRGVGGEGRDLASCAADDGGDRGAREVLGRDARVLARGGDASGPPGRCERGDLREAVEDDPGVSGQLLESAQKPSRGFGSIGHRRLLPFRCVLADVLTNRVNAAGLHPFRG